mmetsp:Transcript_10210/g.27464  ORF Transcript_10210/g.27464 Transcript_10210/m.27464 type:complete len:100 (+) Transcript_10210:2252-2551(+)
MVRTAVACTPRLVVMGPTNSVLGAQKPISVQTEFGSSSLYIEDSVENALFGLSSLGKIAGLGNLMTDAQLAPQTSCRAVSGLGSNYQRQPRRRLRIVRT